MSRTILIDGDVLVYKTAWASEQIIDWGDGLVTLHSKVDEAAQAIDAQINNIKAKLKPDEVVVALTCHETVNFRKEFYPQYKENRNEKRKPLVWKAMREHLLTNHEAKIKPNLEADDILGIMATMWKPDGKEKIIVSIDKDFKTIPCKFFNMASGELSEVSEEEANVNFLTQTLTGDSTDNYPGCAGIGPKRAKALLDSAIHEAFSDTDPAEYSVSNALPVMWRAVLKAFEKAGFGPEFALTQARCARILRASDYDFPTKKPILWSPPV
jgi:DNA polymerase-1